MPELLNALSIPESYHALATNVIYFAGILLVAVIAHFIAKRIILRAVEGMIKRTTTNRDDILVRRKVFNPLVHLVPSLVIYTLTPLFIEGYDTFVSAVLTICYIYSVVMFTLFLDALLDAGLEIYRTFERSRHLPIKSFIQVIKIAIYFVAIISIISLIIGQSPLKLVAGLGAMTAVLMLVFKDPILGFVAGLQLSSNRMVARGDWIEMPKYSLDGDVIEIALTTVKVRNFDNTITTIPTQTLITDSFKNWRGMQQSGGRRIKRALNIDMSSVHFLNEDELTRLSKIALLKDYLDKKRDELAKDNDGADVDMNMLANGRRLTNVGTFRAYIQAYLNQRPDINKNLTFLVRQLKPGDNGLPIEIYVFSAEKRWIQYEGIQADIFFHIIAVAPEFGLRLFQNPTGADMRMLASQNPA
jgi:miniconductance mechanosensitive channel